MRYRKYGGAVSELTSIATANRNLKEVKNLQMSRSPQIPGQLSRLSQNSVSTTILPAGVISVPINQSGGRRKRRRRRIR